MIRTLSMKPTFKFQPLALAMLTATLVLAGCKDAPNPQGKPPGDEISTALDSGAKAEKPDPLLVSVPANFGADLKVAPAGARSVSDTLRVAGRVDFDEYRVSRIGATVTGRVIEINVRLGQQVKVGDALAVINSTELGQAQLDYLKARAQADLQARSVERARQLFAADVIGRAELQRRESELAIASAEQRAAADQLRVLGMSQPAIARLGNNGAINSVTPVVSTVAGTVVERRITQGQVVQPADALYVVADLSEVWVTAEVPEQQAALVRTGQAVDIEVPALGARLTGKLIYVADTVNPETRTVTVRSRVNNTGRQLKPAMLATMLIQAAAVERIVVPAEAVVREADADHVFVETAERTYRLTPVRLGPESGGQRPVLDGLKAGQRIVAAGAFHLNTERKRKELE